VAWCIHFPRTCAERWSPTPQLSLHGWTSRLWLATSSSAGSRMPGSRSPESAVFVGPRRSSKKASVGPAAGRGAATANATASRLVLNPRRTCSDRLPRTADIPAHPARRGTSSRCTRWCSRSAPARSGIRSRRGAGGRRRAPRGRRATSRGGAYRVRRRAAVTDGADGRRRRAGAGEALAGAAHAVLA